jgi:hypothetical protein
MFAERLKRKAIACGSDNAEPVVVTGAADRGILETATATGADLIVMGVAPRTWIDETVSGSTLRGVLRRARTPVLVLPVIAGAHEWIDEVNEEAAFTMVEAGVSLVRSVSGHNGLGGPRGIRSEEASCKL